MMDLELFLKNASGKKTVHQFFLQKLKRENQRKVDDYFHQAHAEVFKTMDCLACANCCKTISPIFYPADIERLSQTLRIKPGQFIEQYLRIDEDGDYVLHQTPCPFLEADNRCAVYAERPKACREYPHTDRKKMIQRLTLTAKNSTICPAAHAIVEAIMKRAKG